MGDHYLRATPKRTDYLFCRRGSKKPRRANYQQPRSSAKALMIKSGAIATVLRATTLRESIRQPHFNLISCSIRHLSKLHSVTIKTFGTSHMWRCCWSRNQSRLSKTLSIRTLRKFGCLGFGARKKTVLALVEFYQLLVGNSVPVFYEYDVSLRLSLVEVLAP